MAEDSVVAAVEVTEVAVAVAAAVAVEVVTAEVSAVV